MTNGGWWDAFDPDAEQTNDDLNQETKVFLSEALISEDTLRKQSFKIISNVLRDIALPKKNHAIRIRTQTQFSMLAFVLKTIDVHGTIDELTITTYTLNKEAYLVLSQLVQSRKIIKLNLLISSSYAFRKKEQYDDMKKLFLELSENFDVHMTFAWLHFKITLARCGDNFYHIEGSMNYSINNMAEQIFFSNDESAYGNDYILLNETMRNTSLSPLEIVC